MIYLLFSTYSSGSTFLLKEISKYMDVPAASGIQKNSSGSQEDNELLLLNETELGLLHFGAYFVYAPEETVDHDPVRTYCPATGKEVAKQRATFRNYLPSNLDTWGDFYLNSVVPLYQEKYKLPNFGEKYSNRLDYVIDIFRVLEERGPIFAKCPKWLNDFSGYTLKLFDELVSHGINIKGIYLYRCPATTFTSIFERKMRLDEVCGGDLDRYSEYVLESVEYSVEKGLELTREYGFFTISYENMVKEFPLLMNYLDIQNYRKIAYRRKYGRRYLLNPRARNSLSRLKVCGQKLSYQYPKNVTFWIYIKELIATIARASRGQHKDVNNPESARTILHRCFWYEADTPRALPLRNCYRWIRGRKKISECV